MYTNPLAHLSDEKRIHGDPVGHVNVVLFCCSLLDMGLPDIKPYSREMQEDLQLLQKSMTVDFAGRLAEEEGFCINVIETDECTIGEVPTGKSGVKRVHQRSGPLSERMAESVSEFFESGGGKTLLVMYGYNPLISPGYIRMMEGLLHQEEEVVVIAGERSSSGQSRIVCAAMRTYHPALFAGTGEGYPCGIEPFLRVEAMLVPVRPVDNFLLPKTLPLLLHEIERQMLLGRWYPGRTLAVLNKMQRKGMFERLS